MIGERCYDFGMTSDCESEEADPRFFTPVWYLHRHRPYQWFHFGFPALDKLIRNGVPASSLKIQIARLMTPGPCSWYSFLVTHNR